MATTMQPMTLVAPACTCCQERATLVPRADLADGMAACPRTGQLYRAEGAGYAPTDMPTLQGAASVPSVRIDLSRSGYA